MGHRHSSTQFDDADSVCLDAGGAARIAAQHSLMRGPLERGAGKKDARGQNAGAASRPSRSAAVWVLLFVIRFYQAVFSHLMPVGCKFYPSCSRYAAEAIAKHGAARGVRLALGRLWRCRPFAPGGFDPVPEADELELASARAEVRS